MQTQIAKLVLLPIAMVAVDEALCQRRKIDDSFIDEVAERLYQRHRIERRGKVKERTFATIPSSERGKYQGVVKDAIRMFCLSSLFKKRCADLVNQAYLVFDYL